MSKENKLRIGATSEEVFKGDYELVVKSARRSLRLFLGDGYISMADWADKYFYLSPESSNVQGPWRTRPYQKAILNLFTNQDVKEVNIFKSARVGYTKMLLILIAYMTTHKRRSGVVFQPTDGDADDFCKDEINPMIRDVDKVGGSLMGDPKKSGANNSLSKKVFEGAVLDIRGGKSPTNYRRMTKDYVLYDEYAAFDADIGGEGSAAELGDMRLDGAPFPMSVRGGTSKIKGTCQIEREYDASEERFQRSLPCPHCNTYAVLEFERMTAPQDDYNKVYYECGECHEAIYYPSIRAMDLRGRWINDDGNVILGDDGLFYGLNGERTPSPRSVGIHLWSIISYSTPWSELWRKYILAMKAKKEGDTSLLKTFTNTRLGRTWEEETQKVPEWVEIMNRSENYKALTVPRDAIELIAGADTQDDRMVISVYAVGKREEMWLVFHQEFMGDPDSGESFSQIDDMLFYNFPHPDGYSLKISMLGIDSGGHRTQAVYNYARKRRNVFALIGASKKGAPVLGRPTFQDVMSNGRTMKNGVKLWSIGTDTVKSIIMARIGITEPGPGMLHFPIGMDEEFFRQLMSEKLTTTYKNNEKKTEWVKTRSRNESLDCLVYAYAAAVKTGIFTKSWQKIRDLAIMHAKNMKPAQEPLPLENKAKTEKVTPKDKTVKPKRDRKQVRPRGRGRD